MLRIVVNCASIIEPAGPTSAVSEFTLRALSINRYIAVV